jgi:hypothetical protein
MKLEINRVDNGYVVNYSEDDNLKVCVFEEREEDIYQSEKNFGTYSLNDNLTVMENLLYFVLEYFGVISSKHNDNNITINIEKNNEKE